MLLTQARRGIKHPPFSIAFLLLEKSEKLHLNYVNIGKSGKYIGLTQVSYFFVEIVKSQKNLDA